jgi:hypothetical protein
MPAMRLPSGHPLPAFDSCIDVKGIKFHAVAAPIGVFSGQKGGATAQEWVQNDVTALRLVQDRVSDESNWFYSRVKL